MQLHAISESSTLDIVLQEVLVALFHQCCTSACLLFLTYTPECLLQLNLAQLCVFWAVWCMLTGRVLHRPLPAAVGPAPADARGDWHHVHQGEDH